MKTALIRNSIVVNVIAGAEPNPQAYDAVVDVSDRYVEPSYLWSGPNVGDGKVFTKPGPEPRNEIPRADFRQRFTPQEQFNADTLAETDPTMRAIVKHVGDVDVVHLDHPATIAGVGYMQQQGILTAERAAAILAP